MNLQNILIFRVGHLGDTVVALPALWAVRRHFPMARLTLLTNIDRNNPHYISPADVLPKSGLIDEYIAYPTNLGAVRSAAAMVNLIRKLRQGKFDPVIYLMPRLRSDRQIIRDQAFFRAAGIRELIGSKYLLEHRLRLPIPVPAPTVETEADFLLAMLDSVGIHSDVVETELLLTGREKTGASEWLRSAGQVPGARRLVALAPGSKWESKVWDEDRFRDVVARLIEKFGIYPIVFGGQEDVEKGDRLLARWGTGVNAAGALGIRESAALLRECSLYLGNDTGTMHLAAAVNTPCVGIFSAIDWGGRWLPFGSRNQCFRRSVECEGCLTQFCFNQHKCLDLIEADDVFDACATVLR